MKDFYSSVLSLPKEIVPIISVVGKSGSGKTKFLTKLIPELRKRGYKIGVIKHDVHSKIDLPNKDTWRIALSGAKPVLIAGPKKMALLQNLERELTLDELSNYFSDVDLILTEGYKKQNRPKIEVYSSGELLSSENELIAVIGSRKINSTPWPGRLPWFRPNDLKGVTRFLEKKFPLRKGARKEINLFVNGQRIPLKFFVKDFIGSAVQGMVKSLKRLPKKINKIELTIYC